MTSNPLVSVIVPVYKAEKYLDKCVRSILSQTYRNLEVILVDDGSPDRSGELCDAFAVEDSRIRVIHQKNGGVSAARNAGLDIMQGQYFCFVDSDDYAETQMVEKLYGAIQFSAAELAISGIKRHSSCGEILWKTEPETIIGRAALAEYFAKYYLQWIASSPCAKLYRSDKLGALRFDRRISLGEDLKFNTQFITGIEKITTIEDCLYNYIEQSNSLTQKYRQGDYEAICNVCETAQVCIKQMLPTVADDSMRNVNYKLISCCGIFMARNSVIADPKAQREFIKQICNNPLVQQAVRDLPPMPLPHRIYAWAISRKWISLLYALALVKCRLL